MEQQVSRKCPIGAHNDGSFGFTRLHAPMSRLSVLACTLSSLLLGACAATPVAPVAPPPGIAVDVPAITRPDGETAAWWYRNGAAEAAARGAMTGKAKNVILFLGDGMSLTTVAAARIFEGQAKGQPGEENLLSWERFPATAFSKTYNTDAQTPDSAGTMTAIATGVKTHMGAIGVSAGSRPDCADSLGKTAISWLQLADSADLATGIVTTARLTHATPGATYAHSPDRNWEATVPEAAAAAGCRDIAQQLLDAPRYGRGPQVVLAGGRSFFTPKGVTDPEYPAVQGRRVDGRNLIAEWQAANPTGQYLWNAQQFAAHAATAPAVLGLFEPEHMQYEHDRAKDPAGEPSLAEMTRAAIANLSRNDKGFVLLVEGARIDHANHAGNAYRALSDTVAMSDAVRAAAEATNPDDTLIIVTADHSHTLNFVGYPARGNPIMDKVRDRGGEDGVGALTLALDATGKPYTTLSYANGPGYTGASDSQPEGPKTHPHRARTYSAANGRPDLTAVDTAHPDYMQEALVPMRAESHGGEDVGIWARGPGSHAVRGTLEQNSIYHVIVQATPALRERLCAAGNCDANGVPVALPRSEQLTRDGKPVR